MNTKLHTEMKTDTPLLLAEGQTIEHYCATKLISIGGFGQVFSGYDQYSHRPVAIKVESQTASIPLLKLESMCLQHINNNYNPNRVESKEPFLQYLAYGKTLGIRYLVMDLSGPNLRELKKATPNDQFSITTSLWVMERMISALKYVHSLGWLHRDVKPANFCIGKTDQRQLFLIDFGMCRFFLSADGSPKPRKPFSAFHGTVRYASLNTHNRQDMSRWDDLWSVFYISVENMVGALPWRFISDKNEVCKVKTTCDVMHQQYGTESGPPASLASLHRVLSSSYFSPESFYIPPNYVDILNRISYDLSIRRFSSHTPLDWQTTTKTCREELSVGVVEEHYVEQNLAQTGGERSHYFV